MTYQQAAALREGDIVQAPDGARAEVKGVAGGRVTMRFDNGLVADYSTEDMMECAYLSLESIRKEKQK